MRRIIGKIRGKHLIQTVPKASMGALPMLISLEFGLSLLAGYFATWFFSSAEALKKGIGIALLLILLDEFLREGYLFRPSDLLVLRMTHEKLFLGVFLMGMATEGYQRYVKPRYPLSWRMPKIF